MKRLPSLVLAAATIAVASGASVAQASAGDDQASADAAIAAFNERMTEAGGIGSPAPDVTPVDPADEPEIDPSEDPFTGCLGDFATALDPSGRLAGETARAFSDNFAFPAPDAPVTTDPLELEMARSDALSASVITVGEGQEGMLDELVALAGSDEFESCMQQIFETPVTFPEEMGTAPAETYPMPEIEIGTESDIGVGDASARLTFSLASAVGDEVYESHNVSVLARTERSLVTVTLTSDSAEPLSGIDIDAELAELVNSL